MTTFWRRLWIVAALFVVYGGLFPFKFDTDLGNVRDNWKRVTFSVRTSPETGRRVSLADVGQNLLLFGPFGLFAAGTFARRRWPARIAMATACGCVFSAGVEALQLFTIDRTTSFNDVVTNTAGTFVGAACFPPVDRAVSDVVHRLRGLYSPVLYPLLVAGAVLCLAAWQPFDATLDPGSLWSKVKTLAIDPWQFKTLRDEGLEFLRYFLFAMLAVWWLRDIGSRAPVGRAALAAVFIAVALESSQLLIESRMPGISDALAHSAGALAGALGATAIREAHSALLCALLAAFTALGAAMFMLTPFEVALKWEPFRLLPFTAYLRSPIV